MEALFGSNVGQLSLAELAQRGKDLQRLVDLDSELTQLTKKYSQIVEEASPLLARIREDNDKIAAQFEDGKLGFQKALPQYHGKKQLATGKKRPRTIHTRMNISIGKALKAAQKKGMSRDRAVDYITNSLRVLMGTQKFRQDFPQIHDIPDFAKQRLEEVVNSVYI